MLCNKISSRISILPWTLLLSGAFANGQTAPPPILATGFCSTGLTAKAAQPQGCLASKLVTPINPTNGGPIVDGNWELAEPFPSAPVTQPAPNPCLFTSSYRPVPVSDPEYYWYNPNDQLSQWIEPNGGSSTPNGWYFYRTRFAVPSAYPGYASYELVLNGQFVADNQVVAIYLEDPAGDSNSCRSVASFTNTSQDSYWNKVKIVVPVSPDSHGYLYFVVLNALGTPGQNPTGLRVEFTSPYLYPY